MGTLNTTVFSGRITVDRPALAGGQTIWITGDPTGHLTLPASVLVPAGQTSVTFSVTKTSSGGITAVRTNNNQMTVDYHVPTISGNIGYTITTKATLAPLGTTFASSEVVRMVGVSPYYLFLTHSVVPNTATLTGRIQLPRPAGTGGAVIQLALSADAAGRVTVPATVTVPEGLYGVTYPITILPNATGSGVSIFAGYLGASAVLTIP
jgi:hypothetical protein